MESSQIVLLLVLLLERGIEMLLHDRIDLFRLKHGLKIDAVLGCLRQNVD